MPESNCPTARSVISTSRSRVAEIAASIGPGLAKAALAGKVDGKLVDTSHRIDADADVAIVTDKDPDGLEVIRHSTRAPARLRGEGALPRRAGDDRPGDRGRLLLRLRVQAAVHARGPRGDREAHGRDREARHQGRAQRDAARRRGEVLPATWASTTRPRSSRRFPRTRTISLYREGDFIDLCRGPHVPSTGKLKVLQADEGRRRVLARRLEERDAAAHLRHRVGEEGRPGRVPAPARGGREARPPQARTRARPLPPAGRGAGHGVLASEGLVDLAAGRAVHAPRLSRQRLPGSALPADPRRVAVGALGPLGELQGEHVHHRVGEARLRGEADELPGPRADLQQRPAQLPRPAAALRRVRRLPSQRALRRAARHHARARLHAGRRPHLLHARSRSSPRSRRFIDRALRGLRATSASPTSRSSSRSRPAKRARHRRGVGPGRERAARRARASAASNGRSCPAKARSTARRSSIT